MRGNGFFAELDWLNTPTALLAVGFSIYCLAIAGLAFADIINVDDFVIWLGAAYGAMYLIFGILLLRTPPGEISSGFSIGFFFIGGFFGGDFSPLMLPFLIVPLIILALTILIIVRFFKGVKVSKFG